MSTMKTMMMLLMLVLLFLLAEVGKAYRLQPLKEVSAARCGGRRCSAVHGTGGRKFQSSSTQASWSFRDSVFSGASRVNAEGVANSGGSRCTQAAPGQRPLKHIRELG